MALSTKNSNNKAIGGNLANKIDGASEDGSEWICGVVEGFYGRPWTPEQRKELFRRMQKMGMNTYVYAPKDDLKHRAYWRDVYTVEEADHLQSLIESAKKYDVVFYYALSPGLDIAYSNIKEMNFLKQKLDQVKSLGCEAFALLFDDIEPTMSDADRQKFSSFTQAQVSVTNEIYEHLGQPKHFMFCPTEYCESRAVPSLEMSDYLRYIGMKLARNINVLWTGPRVISRLLTTEHLSRVASVLRRRPLIWDNLHANDYDNKRIFLGPYAGRPVAIKRNLSGVVTNPNCEFESNYVAMYTLAYWSKCEADAGELAGGEDAALEAGGAEKAVITTAAERNEYHPVRAFHAALDDWLPEILSARVAYARSSSMSIVKPNADMVVGINTCASFTSTTSTNGSLTTTTNSTSIAVSLFPTTPGSLPLYTPVSVAEQIKNPFLAPPMIDPTPLLLANDDDPVLTPAMQAVNSLTDEYSEPMELAGGIGLSGGGQSAMNSGTNSVNLVGSSAENSPEKILGEKATADETAEATKRALIKATVLGEELMETKSIDNLASIGSIGEESKMSKEKTIGGGQEAMIVDSRPPTIAILAEEQQMQVDGGGSKSMAKDEGLEVDVASDHPQSSSSLLLDERSVEITRDDIQLLAELFYLPFEHGPRAYWLIDEYVWLRSNGGVVRRSKGETGVAPRSADEWLRRASEFDQICGAVTDLCRRLVECPNRGLVYDFYPYIWDLQGILNVLNAFVKWIALGHYVDEQNKGQLDEGGQAAANAARTPRPGFKPSVECEPWIFRGGLMAELQRLLPLENAQDLFLCRPPHPPCGRVFRARPYDPLKDREHIYTLCHASILDESGLDFGMGGDQFLQYPELIGDWLAGAYLDLYSETCFVVEDEQNDVVGFALAAEDSRDFYQTVHQTYLPELRAKYKYTGDQVTVKSNDGGCVIDGELVGCGGTKSAMANNSAPCVPGEGIWPAKDMLSYIHYESATCQFTTPHCVHQRYASILVMRVQSSVMDTAAPKRLLAPLLAALRSLGSPGVHGQLRRSEKELRDLYCRMGFFEISMMGEEQTEREYLGRLL